LPSTWGDAPAGGYKVHLTNGTRMKIDIPTEPELISVNHGIVARLRFLNEMRAHAELPEFGIGEEAVALP
jgi:hypothetical protein